MICALCEGETTARPCEHCGGEPYVDGRYELLAVLGRGANGTTYRARNASGDEVALKEMLVRRATSLKNLEMFEREARTLRQLNHVAIPKYLEEFTVDQGPNVGMYIAQELVRGQPLSEELDEPMDVLDVLSIVREVGGILAYLHGLSPPVVHRDVKPQNLIRRGSTVHLIDFGAVQDVVGTGGDGVPTMAGTVGYMAPEQLRGKSSTASDIYALGKTAVALLTGGKPDDETWAVHVPNIARALLLGMGAVDANNRPTARAIEERVEEAIAEVEQLRARTDRRNTALARLEATPRQEPANFSHVTSYGYAPAAVFSVGAIVLALPILVAGFTEAGVVVLVAGFAIAAGFARLHGHALRRLKLFQEGVAVVGRIVALVGHETGSLVVHYSFVWDGKRYQGRYMRLEDELSRREHYEEGRDVMILVDPSRPRHHAPLATFIEHHLPMPH